MKTEFLRQFKINLGVDPSVRISDILKYLTLNKISIFVLKGDIADILATTELSLYTSRDLATTRISLSFFNPIVEKENILLASLYNIKIEHFIRYDKELKIPIGCPPPHLIHIDIFNKVAGSILLMFEGICE